ncbi:MAG: permease-like cell division protein FtsX [Clostridia bacterium]|nr:permease-like cell division protein FtsX [Clostridia bacterium]
MSSKSERRGHASLGYLTKEGFRGIRANKLMSLASVTVLLSCLVLIGAAFMSFVNINALLGAVSEQNVIMIFIQDEATEEQISAMGREIKANPNVERCKFISKEEAFPEVLESIGSAAALFDGMEDNPLPDAYEVTLDDMEQYDKTVSELKKLDNVLNIRQNRDFAQKLNTLKKTVGSISIAVIIVLLVVSLFIIANTVRVTMFSRRLEIMIMKSVGATKWFIRWPFMVEGMVLGVIAGVLSFGIVWGLYEALSNALASLLSALSAKPVPFTDYVGILLGAFVVTGILTGVFGSYVSMNKYLKEQDYDSENVSADHE